VKLAPLLAVPATLLGFGPLAQAQTQTQTKVAEPASRVEAVTVTGESREGFRTSIDRRSYSVSADLAAATGSIGDALRNVPSVEVSPDGVVSMRGGVNVRVLIDGKPSGLLSGPNAALALQSMPADSFERVEVITNPGADLSPEGGAGVINLISKTNRKIGVSGGARAYVAPTGRGLAGFNASRNQGKLTLSLDASTRRHDQAGADGGSQIERFEESGALLSRREVFQNNVGRSNSTTGRAAASYDLDPRTTLSGEARYNGIDYARRTFQHVETQTPDGAPFDNFDLAQPFGGEIVTNAQQATLRRNLGGESRTFTLDLSRDQTDETAYRSQTQDNFVLADLTDYRTVLTQLKADLVRPIASTGAEFKMGYALRIDDNRYLVLGRTGATADSLRPDPAYSNRFVFNQTVHAGYASYQRPIGDLTVLGGLRLEGVTLDYGPTPGALRQSYTELYPSVHLAYALTGRQRLSLSSSRRVDRPSPGEFNPFVVTGGVDLFSGNPDLKPQFTDSVEAGWQYRKDQTFYSATLFRRDSRDAVTTYTQRLADGRLYNRRANLADSLATGLEMSANGKLAKSLTYSMSGAWVWTRIDADLAALTGQAGDNLHRSGGALGGRLALTWQPTPKDTLQVNTQITAPRLTVQGESLATGLMSLGYRHKFDDNLAGFVNIQDIFNTSRFGSRIDTPTLRTRTEFEIDSRVIWLGLAWTFSKGAAAKPREPGFEF